MPYAARQNSTGRLLGMAVTALIHVLAIYAVVTGLARKAVEVIKGPIETEIIEEIKPETDEPPPPPPPKFEQPPPPFIPPPEIAIATPPPASTNVITSTSEKRPPAPPPPPPAPRTAPRQDPRRPFSLPEYPSTSIRLGEEGATTLSCMIGEDGRVKDCSVAQSSGFPRLDEAAVKHAVRSYKFIPAQEGGKPVAYPDHKFRVVFRLQDAR